MRTLIVLTVALLVSADSATDGRRQGRDRAFLTSELIFPLEHWHNHASMVVELPGGDLLACWFHGSGERTADDVLVRGARLKKGSARWSDPFVMADTPGYPDTNATIFLDPAKRLWLLWPTILANEWHTALMKYKISSDYAGDGPPRWDGQRSPARDPRRRVRTDRQPGSRPAHGRQPSDAISRRLTQSSSRPMRRTSCSDVSDG